MRPTRPEPAPLRRGFTLVELLVVVGLIVTLSAIAVGGLRATEKADRIENASQQVKNMFEGARQRAVTLGKPVGVRLNLAYPDREGDVDSNNRIRNPELAPTGTLEGRVVTSLSYVGPTPPYVGTCNLYYQDIPATGDPSMRNWQGNGDFAAQTTTLANMTWQIDDATSEDANNNATVDTSEVQSRPWARLARMQYRVRPHLGVTDNAFLDLSTTPEQVPLGVLTPGVRIEIPAFSEQWYTISPEYFDPAGDLLTLVESVPTSLRRQVSISGGGTAAVPRAERTLGVSYRMDLGLSVMPEYGSVDLPAGVVIDLDGSVLPTPANPIDSLPASWGAAATYPEQVDIVFSPNGSLIASQAGDGVLAMLITTLDDAVRSRQANDGATAPTYRHPQTRVEVNGSTFDRGDYAYAVVADDAGSQEPFIQDERRIVAVYAQTGQVASFDVASDGVTDGLADAPLANATKGRVAK